MSSGLCGNIDTVGEILVGVKMNFERRDFKETQKDETPTLNVGSSESFNTSEPQNLPVPLDLRPGQVRNS